MDDPMRQHGHHDHGRGSGAPPAREGHMAGAGPGRSSPAHHDHHAMMLADFKRRFWISLVLTNQFSSSFNGFSFSQTSTGSCASRVTSGKTVRNPVRATGYNSITMPLSGVGPLERHPVPEAARKRKNRD
jgi:hypothetical protein